MARPSARRAKHHDTTWRPVLTGEGNDAWQRQADAAAWSAVSGMPPERYLGAIEPIPIPADLRAQLREAGKALAERPGPERADALLRLAHRAVYGADDATPPLAAQQEAAGGVSAPGWWDDAAAPETDLETVLLGLAGEAHAALAESDWQPEDGGEVARAEQAKGWWE